MSLILPFLRRREPEPSVTSPARCLNCRHAWQAVVPFESRTLPIECPNCLHLKGACVGAYVPDESTEVWRCRCGGELFYVVRAGLLCPNCGQVGGSR